MGFAIGMLLIFLDTETTGLDVHIHRVIEIAFKVIDSGTQQELAAYSSLIFQQENVWETRSIESFEVTG